MKKLIAITLFLLGFGLTASAQVNPHALGVRLGGGNFGNGAELSYQHGLSGNNRLELDLGWRSNYWNRNRYSHLGISGIYHWVFNIDGGFNFFVGPGAQIGIYDDRNYDDRDGVSLGVGGQIGLEYDFNNMGAPILVGLDWRPMWDFIGYYSGFGYGLALSIRYTW